MQQCAYQCVDADVGDESNEHGNDNPKDGEEGGVSQKVSLASAEEKVFHVAVTAPAEMIGQVDAEGDGPDGQDPDQRLPAAKVLIITRTAADEKVPDD